MAKLTPAELNELDRTVDEYFDTATEPWLTGPGSARPAEPEGEN
jgi:hypothetical protein